jgi:hypothetical protein
LRFEYEELMGLRPGLLKLLMRQQRTDSSPDFPTLAESAAAGCGLCGFLRAGVLQANIRALEKQGEVSIVLSYAWGPRRGVVSKGEGLQALLMTIFDAQGSIATLRFSVYSRDGAYCHDRHSR